MGCWRQEVRAALPAHAASLGKPCLSSGKDLGGTLGMGEEVGYCMACLVPGLLLVLEGSIAFQKNYSGGKRNSY